MYTPGQALLNGNDVSTSYGIVLPDLSALLSFGDAKPVLLVDFADQNGKQYDNSSAVKIDDFEVTLRIQQVAASPAQYWAKRSAFFSELTKPGWQGFFVEDHGYTYQVRYSKTSNWEKSSQTIKNVAVVVVSFDLLLTVKCVMP